MSNQSDKDPGQVGRLVSLRGRINRRVKRRIAIGCAVAAGVGITVASIDGMINAGLTHDQTVGATITTAGPLHINETAELQVTMIEDGTATQHAMLSIGDADGASNYVNGQPGSDDNFVSLNTIVGGDCTVNNDSLSCPSMKAYQRRVLTIYFKPNTAMSVLWGTEQDGQQSAFSEVVH